MLKKLLPVTAAGPREIAGQPLEAIPEPPAWMTPVARAKFVEIGRYLVSLGALTAGEVWLVEAHAAAYGRWREAEERLAAGEPAWRTVTSRGGAAGTTVPTEPMLQSMRSLEALRKTASSLGLAPVERARLPAAGGGEVDEVEEMFKRAGYP